MYQKATTSMYELTIAMLCEFRRVWKNMSLLPTTEAVIKTRKSICSSTECNAGTET